MQEKDLNWYLTRIATTAKQHIMSAQRGNNDMQSFADMTEAQLKLIQAMAQEIEELKQQVDELKAAAPAGKD